MTKTRMFLFAALAVILVLGVAGQANAQVKVSGPRLTAAGPAMSHVNPNTSTDLHPVATYLGVAPPADGSGNAEWPCFTGGSDPDCSSIPAGGVVVGVPAYTWSLTGCTGQASSAPCAGINFWFEDDSTSSSDISVALTVKQGTSYIYDFPKTSFGSNSPYTGYIIVFSADVAFGDFSGNCPKKVVCVNPVAGTADITATVSIGTDSAVSKATFALE